MEFVSSFIMRFGYLIWINWIILKGVTGVGAVGNISDMFFLGQPLSGVTLIDDLELLVYDLEF